MSYRNNTFLDFFDLSVNKLFNIIYHWSIQCSQTDIQEILKVSRPTINKVFQNLRKVCIKQLNKENIVLGGNGVVVEIDESLFVRVKHNKGKDLKRDQVWVFGLYERDTTRCLFFVVVKRDAVNLLNLIYKYVAPNSIIHSDCWASYNRIKRLDKNYVHRTVNHDLYFVDPVTRCHTNSIESIWCSAKMHLKKMRGVKRCYLQSYLDEYTWRHNKNLTRYGAFEAVLSSISNIYQPGKNLKEEKDKVDDLLDDLDAMEINDQEFEFGDDDKERVPLEDGNIDELNPLVEQVVDPLVDPVVDPLVEPVVDPLVELIYEVNPLSKLDLLSFEETIDLIIKQIEEGLYLEYRFSSDLNKAQRKIIYEKCDLKNINYSKSGTRYVIVTIGINKVKNDTEILKNAKELIAKELKSLSQVECPRDENVDKILIENDESVKRGKRGRPKKNLKFNFS
ncbi:unnamed protein product [Brachionus calyciflorus]|uniref:ISXO2-like transposase domain-containing protein n=1 Tax=Brachionus calyciflorus TaxID=104777 RepID=A0A814HUY4_9BILA|nr:unnamed protein product [Brachionus calyciflorus]